MTQPQTDEIKQQLAAARADTLALEHERQHQETLAYLLQLLDPQKKMRPQITSTIAPDVAAQSTTQAVSAPPHDMIKVPAGEFTLGAQWPVFVYDNELPAHTVHVPAFKIDRLL